MLDFFAALLTSALGGTGVGGGGLLVLYLTLVRDVPQLRAQGINLLFFLVGAASSFFVHAFRRHLNVPLLLTIGVLGLAGAFLGAAAATVVDTTLLQKAFGALLAASGVKALFARKKS